MSVVQEQSQETEPPRSCRLAKQKITLGQVVMSPIYQHFIAHSVKGVKLPIKEYLSPKRGVLKRTPGNSTPLVLVKVVAASCILFDLRKKKKKKEALKEVRPRLVLYPHRWEERPTGPPDFLVGARPFLRGSMAGEKVAFLRVVVRIDCFVVARINQ